MHAGDIICPQEMKGSGNKLGLLGQGIMWSRITKGKNKQGKYRAGPQSMGPRVGAPCSLKGSTDCWCQPSLPMVHIVLS